MTFEDRCWVVIAEIAGVRYRCNHLEREHIPEPTVGPHCARCHKSNTDEHCKHSFVPRGTYA